jgi:hypothetical protein
MLTDAKRQTNGWRPQVLVALASGITLALLAICLIYMPLAEDAASQHAAARPLIYMDDALLGDAARGAVGLAASESSLSKQRALSSEADGEWMGMGYDGEGQEREARVAHTRGAPCSLPEQVRGCTSKSK